MRVIKHLKDAELIEQTKIRMVRNLQEKYYRSKARQFTVDLSIGESKKLMDQIEIQVSKSTGALKSAFLDLSQEDEEKMTKIFMDIIRRTIEIQNNIMEKKRV